MRLTLGRPWCPLSTSVRPYLGSGLTTGSVQGKLKQAGNLGHKALSAEMLLKRAGTVTLANMEHDDL